MARTKSESLRIFLRVEQPRHELSHSMEERLNGAPEIYQRCQHIESAQHRKRGAQPEGLAGRILVLLHSQTPRRPVAGGPAMASPVRSSDRGVSKPL